MVRHPIPISARQMGFADQSTGQHDDSHVAYVDLSRWARTTPPVASSQPHTERKRRRQEPLDLLADQAPYVEQCLGRRDLDLGARLV